MAINFPDSPGIGSVFTDSTSGFSYEWTGTLWKSYSASTVSNIQILDDISGSFDNSETTFNLTVSGSAVAPVNAQQIEVILGGIQQSPGVDYTISGTTVIFTTAPTGGLTFSGKLLGTALSLGAISSSDDTTTNSDFFPIFVDGTSESQPTISTSKLTFNPSTGKLTSTIVNSSSDENLKKDITTIENALDKVKQLRGVDFVWKETDQKGKGVIAQELQQVFPELVSKESDGNLSVNYTGLIAVLIQAIKEI